MAKQEYFIVKDQDGKSIGKRKVISKNVAENVAAYIINRSMLVSFGAYISMQEECENLPEVEEK